MGIRETAKIAHDKFDKQTKLLKFLAQHPYKELEYQDGDVCQIMKIDYPGKEITLRDFCEYSLKEILEMKGFKDKTIDIEWKKLIKSLE